MKSCVSLQQSQPQLPAMGGAWLEGSLCAEDFVRPVGFLDAN